MFSNNKTRFKLLQSGLVASLLFSMLGTTSAWAGEPTSEDVTPAKVYLPMIMAGRGNLAQADLEQQALQKVAAQNNLVVGNLALLHSAATEYTALGKRSQTFKVLDHTSGLIYGVALDDSGQVVDAEQWAAEEEAVYAAQFGRLDPTLANTVVSAAADTPLSVIIWLKTAEAAVIERPAVNVSSETVAAAAVTTETLSTTEVENQVLAESGNASDTLAELPAEVEAAAADEAAAVEVAVDLATIRVQAQQEAYFAQVDAQRALVVAEAATPVINRLHTMGVSAVTADPYTPLLYAQLRPHEIQSVAAWAEVDAVYLDQTAQPTLDIARRTVYAHSVNNRGFTGAGIRVAQVEVGGLIALNNPYLRGVVQDTTYACSDSHGTWVAGAIRSTHSSVRGVAPGVLLWAGGSCSGNFSQLQNRSTAAANWGARVINLSLGADSNRATDGFARYYDNLVINRFRTVIVAAGNIGSAGCAQGTTGNVMTPGTAYNVITVGNFNDKNSTSWSGDGMNPCSSWRDPNSANGDREKPEIAAPGTDIKTTSTASPWVGDRVTGTSFAAPIVAGVAALLMQRNPELATWPEAVKAILMATAVHNIEGAARLSEFDGAGGLVAHYADDVARGRNGSWGAQDYTCATPSTLNATTMNLTAGKRTRVVIVWDNDPAYSGYASRPGADLDLAIVNAAGTVVASSTMFDNTYEIVDFTPSASGNYTLRVSRFRCNYNPRYLGWAWFRN